MDNFRVGQKVVCVDGDNFALKNPINRALAQLPTKGRIYTIRGIFNLRDNSVGFHLEEISNRHLTALGTTVGPIGEIAFLSTRFKPLISQADDVEMFQRISEDSLGRLEAYEELLNERFSCDETHE